MAGLVFESKTADLFKVTNCGEHIGYVDWDEDNGFVFAPRHYIRYGAGLLKLITHFLEDQTKKRRAILQSIAK